MRAIEKVLNILKSEIGKLENDPSCSFCFFGVSVHGDFQTADIMDFQRLHQFENWYNDCIKYHYMGVEILWSELKLTGTVEEYLAKTCADIKLCYLAWVRAYQDEELDFPMFDEQNLQNMLNVRTIWKMYLEQIGKGLPNE